jgi:hypothetical protein
MKYKILLLLLTGFILIQGCDSGLDGNLNENIPPTTSLTVNEINLPEGERLISQVNISWWGDDPDGYVVGFEFFIGEGADDAGAEWTFTTRNDSIFVLPIDEGELDANVRFTVRAVDNLGAVDPDPPSLVFPIRNSPPSITFVNTELPPDTTFRIVSFGYRASDPDGDANLNRVEIALNDTTTPGSWKEIPLNIDLVTLRVDDTLPTPIAEVFIGRAANSTDITFNTVNVNNENTFYVRAIDNAAAVSEVKEHTWFVKEQTSRILFLNDYHGPQSAVREALHLGLLAQIGFDQIDYMNISDRAPRPGGQRVLLSAAFPDRSLGAPTINMMFAEWDHIYWLSNDLNRNIGYALEMTLDFFDNGGTMFVNIPTRFIQDDNPLLEFLPFERVQPVPAGQSTFVIPSDSLLIPDAFVSNPPFLKTRQLITAVNPIVPFGESISLFEAPFRVRDPFGTTTDYNGPKLVSALSPDQSVLFFGLDLDIFTRPTDNDPSDLPGLLQLFLIETLGFQQ